MWNKAIIQAIKLSLCHLKMCEIVPKFILCPLTLVGKRERKKPQLAVSQLARTAFCT